MRNRAIVTALLAVCAAGGTAARAEVGASGTRLSVAGGAARFYMTYGHAEEPELYAPIIPELNRFGVTFSRRGEDYAIFHRGTLVANWPIVRSREDVPETGDHPCVLVMGGNIFVPVRMLSEVLPIDVKWDKKDNLVALVPGADRKRPPVAVNPPSSKPEITGEIVLSGIELVPGTNGVQVRVRASERVNPTWLYIKSPARIALDFPNARWAPGVSLPAGAGEVRGARTGQFTQDTARLVLELGSPATKVTGFAVQKEDLVVTVGQGRAIAALPRLPRASAPSSTADAQLQYIDRRKNPLPQRASRGGLRLPNLGGARVPGVRPAGSLAGKVICVDAGHGGHSSGAKGLYNLEKDLCLKMCLKLQRELEERGARVVMTRDNDTFVSLEGRCQIANSAGADLFISIHLNSTPRRNSASGTETYWHTPQSARLAQALHGRVIGSVRGEDRRIRNRGFYVIRNTNMPSVLLEIAFINNEDDELLLSNGDFHSTLAEELANGVLDYFNR